MVKILAISGSLRSRSSSHAILKYIVEIAPENIEIEMFNNVGQLPHFDDPDTQPELIKQFSEKVIASDAVLICTPEYAFGIPGSLKNALDWTVGTGVFLNKPVGLITASSQGEKGHAALILVLNALSAKLIDGGTLLISAVRSKFDEQGQLKDAHVKESLKNLLDSLVKNI